MRNTIYLLSSIALVVLGGVGCAGPEQKLGRGLSNMTEIARGGEFERSEEQAGLFQGTDSGVATGFVRGVNRTLARTGVGIYEVVTAPLPPYGPVWTDYLAPSPSIPTPIIRANGRMPCLTPIATAVSVAEMSRLGFPAAGFACSTTKFKI